MHTYRHDGGKCILLAVRQQEDSNWQLCLSFVYSFRGRQHDCNVEKGRTIMIIAVENEIIHLLILKFT